MSEIIVIGLGVFFFVGTVAVLLLSPRHKRPRRPTATRVSAREVMLASRTVEVPPVFRTIWGEALIAGARAAQAGSQHGGDVEAAEQLLVRVRRDVTDLAIS